MAVHAENGWLAIADPSSWLADAALYLNEAVMSSSQKLSAANNLLETHGNIDWLTSSGKFVVLNNGIEFAATYFVMLSVLMIYGGGRYVSADWWIFDRKKQAQISFKLVSSLVFLSLHTCYKQDKTDSKESNVDALSLLLNRASQPRLKSPAPSGEALENIMQAALRTSYHAELNQWRFVVCEGHALNRLGSLFEQSAIDNDKSEKEIERAV